MSFRVKLVIHSKTMYSTSNLKWFGGTWTLISNSKGRFGGFVVKSSLVQHMWAYTPRKLTFWTQSHEGLVQMIFLFTGVILKFQPLVFRVVGPRPLDGRGVFCTRWMLRNWSGVGGGGDDHIPCTCTHVGCCATGQGWVGGGDDHIPCTCTHVGCCATGQGWVGGGMITFLALAHMLDAAQLVRGGWGGGWSHSLHLHTRWMLRNWSGVGGGGMITFLALAHTLDATQLVGMITFLALAHTLDATQLVGDDHISCTCTHVGCYATGRGWSHSLHLRTRWMLRNWSGMITFLALAHMLDATQLVGDDHIPCTCTHVGCYATGRGWSHFLHLHTCWMITFLAHMLDAERRGIPVVHQVKNFTSEGPQIFRGVSNVAGT